MNQERPLPPLQPEREHRQQLEALASSRSPVAGFEHSNGPGRGHSPGLILLASSAAVVLVLLGGPRFFNRIETPVADLV